MKSTKFITISILLLTLFTDIKACWYPVYKPSEYYIFYTYNEEEYEKEKNNKGAMKRNINDWVKYTKSNVEYNDTWDVVYNYSIDEMKDILNGDTTRLKIYTNTFAKYLIDSKDKEVIELLILAKRCEYARERRNNTWWYPSKEDLEYTDLKEILDEALSYKGKKMKARYLLQAMRVAYTMQNYDLCMKIWNEKIKDMPESAVRSMCEDYIGGIYFKQGDYETAMKHYANTMTVSSSLWWCIKNEASSDIERIKLLYKYVPNSPELAVMVQNICRRAEEKANTKVFDGYDLYKGEYYLEDLYGYTSYKKNRDRYIALRDFALKVVSEKRSDNPAMWQYAASFLTLLDGDIQTASQYIEKAKKLKGTLMIKNNIKVLDIMIDAMSSKYDLSFETRILSKMQWLDKMIENNITNEIKEDHNNCNYNVNGNYYNDRVMFDNYKGYYYNDMMRKISLSIMAPKFLEKGDTIKYMLLGGMASERMRTVCNFREENKEEKQNPDFRTDIFVMIDTLSIENVLAYKNVLEKGGKNRLEKFLSEKCYKNSDDYFNEIIGTKYMRIENFDKAVEYLSKVSPEYESTLNIYPYFRYHPFSSLYRTEIYFSKTPINNYKLNFATHMLDLKKLMSQTQNNSDGVKLEAMYQYALGMIQASDCCWPLLRYKNGTDYNLKPDNYAQWSKSISYNSDQLLKKASALKKKKYPYQILYIEEWLSQCDRFASYIENGPKYYIFNHN